MKIAIYAIALNEEKFARRFAEAGKDADVILVGDTGSNDRTCEILQDHGVDICNVWVRPWRFDMARNAVLCQVPRDVDLCLPLDLDEVLRGGWRDRLEENFRVGTHHRVRFRFVHNFKPDGSYGTVGLKDRFHIRENYTWRHIVHERVYYEGAGDEEVLHLNDLVVEHHQDFGKKHTYLELMERECRGETSARHMFWLGREYIYAEKWEQAIETFERYLSQPETWHVERAWAMMFMAKAHEQGGDRNMCIPLLLRASSLTGKHREPWMALTEYYVNQKDWPHARVAINHALSITQRTEHYLVRGDSWGAKPHDIAALCAFKTGDLAATKEHIAEALRLEPDNREIRQKAERFDVKLED